MVLRVKHVHKIAVGLGVQFVDHGKVGAAAVLARGLSADALVNPVLDHDASS